MTPRTRAEPATADADTLLPGSHREAQSGRRTLPAAAAFWILAVPFLMLFIALAAAAPLYRVYQVQFRFSATTLHLTEQ